ncbi:B3/B4 domain-containing protein, partial [Streptomyces nodosus]
WHTAYRSFGTNPRRIRPSVDALGRRFAKRGTLPRINPAVDSYNAVSVRHGLPAGAFDLDHVTGDVEIRYADGSETFTPLGEPGTVENPKPGEIIYTDSTDVLTRHWNHRDAHRTRVTEDSAHVAFVLETVTATRDGDLLKIAAEELHSLLAPHAGLVTVGYLSLAV